MASGFRHPVRTQAGRDVRLSEKARLIMVEAVWKEVSEVITVIEHAEDAMMSAVEDRRSKRLAAALYSAWSKTRSELEDLVQEYWDLTTQEEQREHDEKLQRWRQRLHDVSETVEHYICDKKTPASEKKTTATMGQEEKRLASEIKQVEQQISRLSMKTPTTASKKARPDPSWVTISRCTEDQSRPNTRDADTQARSGFDPASSSSPMGPAPRSNSGGTHDNSDKLIDSIAVALSSRREMLPRLEPEVFRGEMMQFPMWLNSFEALIEKHTTSAQERLFFLGKYTGGEAREAISGYLTLFAEDAYPRAKRLLIERYGDRLKVAQAYRNKLFAWQTIKKNDGPAVQQYADFLWQCCAAMKSVGHLESLNSAEENTKMVRVLPQYIIDKWFRVVDRWYHLGSSTVDEDDLEPTTSSFPPFEEFCRLVSTEARIVTGPAFKLLNQGQAEKPKQEASKPTSSNKPSRKAQSFASSASAADESTAQAKADKPKVIPSCFFCKDAHFLSTCTKFLQQSSAVKKDFAAENHLCFGCLGRGHGFRSCRWKKPDLFKDPDPPVRGTTLNTRTETQFLSKKGSYFSMVVPVRVISSSNKKSTVVYALLDTQSDTTFVSEELIETLGLQSEEVRLHLVTMGGAQTVSSQKVKNLTVQDVFSDSSLTIPESFSRVLIPASREQLPDPAVVAKHDHLKPMLTEMMSPNQSIHVGMLIGNDQPAAFVCRGMLHKSDDLPFAVRTKLGWSLMGKKDCAEKIEISCFSTSARVVNVGEISKVFDLDFVDIKPNEEKMSYEDQLFVQKARESIHRKPNGKLEMDLPFREEPALVPNNRDVAYKRLMSVKRKMQSDAGYRRMYCDFMQGLLENDYAEIAPVDAVEGRVQFMPHHAVAHPRKPGELRGVFDAAAEKMGISLNKLLLPGPDMTNNLLGVLCGFRREQVAFMCDIRKMFMQVGVSEHHRDYLRFLWFADSDPAGDVIEYRMKVLSFGATSSPACASYAFKELATLYENEFEKDVIDFMKRKFYVDDGLAATETARRTVELFMSTHELCKKGGFWLHKFTSNSIEALESVPSELLSNSVREWLLTPDKDGTETSLGVTWDRVKDAFVFLIKSFQKQLTRRGLLSALSGVYDPIGFLAPVILVGRLLLQELCGQALPWDQPLEEIYVERWTAWYDELFALSSYYIPRCVRSFTSGEIVKAEMHHFCDASSIAYGACSYLRLEDSSGVVDVSLVLAKARVGPKRAVTIPRMELQSAVLATKLSTFLSHELSYDNLEHWYWTDSMVVLGYISNPAKRFHLYVANRVQRIRDSTNVDHWNHVPGEDNPANAASRGLSAGELMNSKIWLSGPSFVKGRAVESTPVEVSDDDPEVKRAAIVHTAAAVPSWIQHIATSCRSWYKLIFRVSVLSKFAKYVHDRQPPAKITREDLNDAGKKVLLIVQREEFAAEIDLLLKAARCSSDSPIETERRRSLNQQSRLKKLDVFLDSEGIIRVGGRLRRAYMPVQVKHPIVVPRRGRVTWLLLLQAHLLSRHSGRQQTLAELRLSGYWVLHARAAVDEILKSCVTCKKMKAAPMFQKMADLPASRVRESPPFTFCGVDLFGPVQIKEGRSLKKRWVCLVTCMASRAVHLEPVYSLSTDSFLNALRRLISRRGPVQQIYCDQGTNFVGASREMQACLAELDEDKIRQELLKAGCDWAEFKFNPPTASHMGGVWERMVKSAKTVLLHLLSQLGEWIGDEMLWTLLAEVEGTLNSRPIACVDVQDPWSEPPLTPARLLTQKFRGSSYPPGKFEDVEVYGRKAWRRVQAMSDRFWRQWRVEFLPDLQLRKKWANRQFNLKVGDIVLMVDKDLKRNQWPMARVTETIPSGDGLVRSVRLQVGHTFFERPIAKLVFLCPGDE